MARKPIIAGNWKMHKNRQESADLANALVAKLGTYSNVEAVLCPVFTSLEPVRQAIQVPTSSSVPRIATSRTRVLSPARSPRQCLRKPVAPM